MLKLLVCIAAIFGISVCLLQLRQQRLNDRWELNRLHGQVEKSQAKLWNQQLGIAAATTPQALDGKLRGVGGGLGEERIWLRTRGD